MTDVIDKKLALRRYFPRPFYKLSTGKGIAIATDAIGSELNDAATQTANARAQFLLATAEGQYLDVHGVNVDIVRPNGLAMTDTQFRNLIRFITNSPKNIEQAFENLIVLFFGPSALASGQVDAYSYRKNEIVVQVDGNALIAASNRSLLGTTYLHINSANAFTGIPDVPWSTTLAAPIATGDTSATVVDSTGIPDAGMVQLGAAEIKLFVLSGSTLTFMSPTTNAYTAGTAVSGPSNPDNYPSGYIYHSLVQVDLIASILAGSTSVAVGAIPVGFPTTGVVVIGDPAGSAYEAKGYTLTLSPNTLHFMGPTAFDHVVSEEASIPTMTRSVKTTLAQSITAGTSIGGEGDVSVVLSADFPLTRGAVKFDNGGNSAEIVPFLMRKVGDNTKILVDPNYIFQNNHLSGERVNLMSTTLSPRTTGQDYAFYLNDSQDLQNAFFAFLRRIKVTGCKITFVIT